MTNMSAADQVIEAVKNFPGSTPRELTDLIPGSTLGSVQQMCLKLLGRGVLARTRSPSRGPGTGVPPFLYTLGDGTPPEPKAQPELKKSRTKKATVVGYEATIEELRAKIAELNAWKVAAIERFPDLGVPPTILAARKIVAEQLRESGDGHGAADAMRGLRDGTLLVKSVVAALESKV